MFRRHLPLLTILICFATSVGAQALTVLTEVDATSYSWFGTVTVTATVTDGGAPVVDCDMVTAACGASPELPAILLDDGLAPDQTAADGIYSGRFHLGGDSGRARPTGSYRLLVTASKGGDSGEDLSPWFSLFSVRRWTGINTSGVIDIHDSYTEFSAQPTVGGWHHRIGSLGLIRSSTVGVTRICVPILPATNTVSNVTVTGSGVTNITVRNNVIEFDCNLAQAVSRVDIEFDAPSDLAATLIDRYHTGDFGQRNFRNGYLVWNRYLHTGILGSDYSSPHGPGCIVDLHATDLVTGEAHTIDCMERVAVHLDNSARSDGTGTYPYNIKWTGDSAEWFVAGDLDTLTFTMHSGGNYGLRTQVEVTKTVRFAAASRMFHHLYRIENIDYTSHDFDFVWGREQWLYGTNSGSNRDDDDRGLLPNDVAVYGGEYSFRPPEIDGNWFAAFDLGSNYAIGVILPPGAAAGMPDYVHLHCDPPLGSYQGFYPINPSGYCTDMPNIFFEKRFGVLSPGEAVSYEFLQWGGYGLSRDDLEQTIWRDAVMISGAPLALEFLPLGDEVPVNAGIGFLFNKAMERASVESGLTISPLPIGEGDWFWSEGDTRAVYQPAQPLAANTVYSVELSRTARDVAGGPLATVARWDFATGDDLTAIVADDDLGPGTHLLADVSPNPCPGPTTISFSLPVKAHTRLAVYDVLGRRVRMLSDLSRARGAHSIAWDGLNDNGHAVAAGVYFCRLEADELRMTKKIVVLN
ncbi:MAG: T9SS type A sorting domain-containing protein [bacterium]|nr:T9SS type A sorting domain-containing protein [bacterium]